MSLIVDEHREYLADPARVGAFRSALQSVVRPGDIGLDLASGTGILGMLACRAGASRVYAIESGDIPLMIGELMRDEAIAATDVDDRAHVVGDHGNKQCGLGHDVGISAGLRLFPVPIIERGIVYLNELLAGHRERAR